MLQDDWDTPKNGDFVRYIERLTAEQSRQLPTSAPLVQITTAAAPAPKASGPGRSPEARRAEAERRRQFKARAKAALGDASQVGYVFMVFVLMGVVGIALHPLLALLLTWALFSWQRR